LQITPTNALSLTEGKVDVPIEVKYQDVTYCTSLHIIIKEEAFDIKLDLSNNTEYITDSTDAIETAIVCLNNGVTIQSYT
jgi:hypothetical protein